MLPDRSALRLRRVRGSASSVLRLVNAVIITPPDRPEEFVAFIGRARPKFFCHKSPPRGVPLLRRGKIDVEETV